jgi:hypothetical protein
MLYKDSDWRQGETRAHGQVLFEVTLARRMMHHYLVPEDAVAYRMEEMGM